MVKRTPELFYRKHIHTMRENLCNNLRMFTYFLVLINKNYKIMSLMKQINSLKYFCLFTLILISSINLEP